MSSRVGETCRHQTEKESDLTFETNHSGKIPQKKLFLRPLPLFAAKKFMSTAYQIVVCGSIVPDPLQTLEPVAAPTGPALKNEMMLPAVLDPWRAARRDTRPTVRESQRDSIIQPRVARNELPWVGIQTNHLPQRGCITRPPIRCNPFRVVFNLIHPPSVGRLRRPTLG